MPRPHPCLAPPPAPIAPHHLSTAPLRPHQLGSPRPHRDHRVPSPASHLPHCVPPSASPYVATEQIPRSSPPPSRPSCAAAVLHVLRASRPPCADIRVTPHLSPRVAAAPGPWPARTAPYASLFRRMREKGPLPGNIRPKCMLFEIKMATSSPYASHFRAQSGDSGYMARESCRQGPFFASRSPKSRMARRCCQRRPAFPRQRHAAWPNGLCAMRQRPAVRRNWLCAMRRGPGLLAACAPPCRLACVRRGLRPLPSRPRSSPPSYTRRASPSETRHAVPAPMHLATCAPHPSRQPR